mgnify:CR=1 FL=1
MSDQIDFHISRHAPVSCPIVVLALMVMPRALCVRVCGWVLRTNIMNTDKGLAQVLGGHKSRRIDRSNRVIRRLPLVKRIRHLDVCSGIAQSINRIRPSQRAS